MLHRAGAARQFDEDLDAMAAGLDEAIRAAADQLQTDEAENKRTATRSERPHTYVLVG
jgi:hypothetical protein